MNTRNERANAEILRCLTEIIQTKINNPRIKNKVVTLSKVECSPDFKFCKVWVSSLNVEDIDEIVSLLNKSQGFIKKNLASMVDMPYLPKFNFLKDKSTENVLRVEELLHDITYSTESESEE